MLFNHEIKALNLSKLMIGAMSHDPHPHSHDHDHDHSHDHDHHHHHDHDHDHGSDLSQAAIRVRALETILTEKGYVDQAALDLIVETY